MSNLLAFQERYLSPGGNRDRNYGTEVAFAVSGFALGVAAVLSGAVIGSLVERLNRRVTPDTEFELLTEPDDEIIEDLNQARCVYCNAPQPKPGVSFSHWVLVSYGDRRTLMACCTEHLEAYLAR